MPLLTVARSTVGQQWGRPVQLGSLPTFNLTDRDFIVTDIDGWESMAKPDAILVGNGGTAGAVASGAWLPAEAYYTVSGVMFVDASAQGLLKRLLWQSAPADRDTAMIVYSDGGEPDLQAFVRLYDKPDIVRTPTYMEFVLPLVAPDPYKYALEPLTGTVGVFTGQTWYQTYSGTGPYYTTYSFASGRWADTYQQLDSSGAFPESLSLSSDGDAASQRVTFSVSGPLDQGDWWLLEETTGLRLWADLGVQDGQTLVFDCAAKTAHLDGIDVSYLVYGDWLSLPAGPSLFRLVGGAASAATATITALPAYL